MRCIECKACAKGWFPSKPSAYVCIGVREPFVISDINHECTEYPEKEFKNEKCNLCKGDKKFKINFIMGMNCTSRYAVFDLGRMDDVKFCPECGRRLV